VVSHSVYAKGAQDVRHYDDNQVDNGSHRNNDTVYHYYIRVSVTKVRSYFETYLITKQPADATVCVVVSRALSELSVLQ
jgi:hypothetical protein